jgi:WD40 repeat protein
MKVAFGKEGQIALTATAGSTARLWDLKATNQMGRAVVNDQAVRCMSFSPDGHHLAAGCEDGMTRFWNMAERGPSKLLIHQGGLIAGLGWSASGDCLMMGGEDKRIGLWAFPSGKSIHRMSVEEPITRVAALSEGKGFLSGQRGQVKQWDEQGMPTGPALSAGKYNVHGLVASPAGRTAWMANGDPEARCFDLESGQIVKSIGHPNPVRVLALSVDGKTLLVGSAYEGLAKLWDLPTGSLKGAPLLMKSRGVVAAAFSTDGQEVLICNEDSARLWDVATGKPLGPRFPEPRCLCGASSPSGAVVATGGKYGARLWHLPEPATGTAQSLRNMIETLTGVKN